VPLNKKINNISIGCKLPEPQGRNCTRKSDSWTTPPTQHVKPPELKCYKCIAHQQYIYFILFTIQTLQQLHFNTSSSQHWKTMLTDILHKNKLPTSFLMYT